MGRRPFLMAAMALGNGPLVVLLSHLTLGTSLLLYYPAMVLGGGDPPSPPPPLPPPHCAHPAFLSHQQKQACMHMPSEVYCIPSEAKLQRIFLHASC